MRQITAPSTTDYISQIAFWPEVEDGVNHRAVDQHRTTLSWMPDNSVVNHGLVAAQPASRPQNNSQGTKVAAHLFAVVVDKSYPGVALHHRDTSFEFQRAPDVILITIGDGSTAAGT